MKKNIRSLLPAALIGAAAATSLAPDTVSARIFWDTASAANSCKGDSQTVDHEDEIDILSWAWGLSRPANLQPGQTLTAYSGPTNIAAITLVKELDSATTCIYNNMIQGKLFVGDTTLSINQNSGDGGGLFEFLKVELTNAAVTSSQTGFSENASGAPTESLTVVFEKICLTVSTQNQDGTSQTVGTACWDNLKNVK
jgi:type VI secretion system secreted protein Hcp